SDRAIKATGGSILSRLFSRKAITPAGQFKEIRTQLIDAASLVAGSLGSMGLSSVLLNTKELIDLLYSTYNQDIARRQKLFNASFVDAKIITTRTNQT
ncbi:hypothetical protein KJ836_02960, partial [Patescibacteria group bacterium]|nr:hypothetical protein [Patescibacteria group bacterium]